MFRYEIAWKENDGSKFGLTKHKGFKYRDDFERFLKRLLKKAAVTILEIVDGDKPVKEGGN